MIVADKEFQRIYLVGFMGSGKSYTGKLMAKELNWQFVDLDDWLETHLGMTIAAYFSQQGEEAFRRQESEILRQSIQFENTVIACGGGTPCFFDNMDWINAHGLSIYINIDPELIAKRLQGEMEKRPLLQGLTQEGLLDFIQEKIKYREAFYRKADLTLAEWVKINGATNTYT
ncbi:MAG TPA: shikimate kinase [Saprospiraceae bacterium]|nr:shikimate kinase [Saprospiraceae bacterium]HMQ81814.1 shikimate kinase [Saprospiraceae bacterium]